MKELQNPALTAQQEKLTSGSALKLYRELVVADGSLLELAKYELSTLLFGNLSGLLGYAFRSLFYPYLFRSVGARPAFGKGLVLRNLKQVVLGNKVMLDDYSTLDVRGNDGLIELGDLVSIGRYSTITSKRAEVKLSAGVNVGSYCRIASQSRIEIGESVLIAAYSYIGPGNHQATDSGKPLISQEMQIKGGVKIGAHAWIGTKVTILDGVTIGEGAIIGAHSLVLEDIPANAIAIGTPAKVVKYR